MSGCFNEKAPPYIEDWDEREEEIAPSLERIELLVERADGMRAITLEGFRARARAAFAIEPEFMTDASPKGGIDMAVALMKDLVAS